MQRSSANQSECSEQADPRGGSSIRENNQQANREDIPRESKLKLMDYSPGHLNRSKSFFTFVTHRVTFSVILFCLTFWLGGWLPGSRWGLVGT